MHLAAPFKRGLIALLGGGYAEFEAGGAVG
jgi:hypothetical protein